MIFTDAPAGTDLRLALASSAELAATRIVYLPAPRERRPASGATVPWRLGDDAPSETWAQWASRKWSETTAGLHRIVYGGATAAFTGVVVPSEIKDPAAAADYLSFAVQRLGDVYGWPAEGVAQVRGGIKAAGVGATVVDTIARIRPLGPDPSWRGASSWYAIADEMSRSAVLVSTGEASAKLVEGATSYADEIKAIAFDLSGKVDRALGAAEQINKGAGVGIGLVAGTAAVAVGLWFAWPFLVEGKAATAAAAAARGR